MGACTTVTAPVAAKVIIVRSFLSNVYKYGSKSVTYEQALSHILAPYLANVVFSASQCADTSAIVAELSYNADQFTLMNEAVAAFKKQAFSYSNKDIIAYVVYKIAQLVNEIAAFLYESASYKPKMYSKKLNQLRDQIKIFEAANLLFKQMYKGPELLSVLVESYSKFVDEKSAEQTTSDEMNGRVERGKEAFITQLSAFITGIGTHQTFSQDQIDELSKKNKELKDMNFSPYA